MANNATDPFNRFGMLAPGYNLNRDPFQLLAKARFDIRDVWRERFPFTFWPLGSHYPGIALRPRN